MSAGAWREGGEGGGVPLHVLVALRYGSGWFVLGVADSSHLCQGVRPPRHREPGSDSDERGETITSTLVHPVPTFRPPPGNCPLPPTAAVRNTSAGSTMMRWCSTDFYHFTILRSFHSPGFSDAACPVQKSSLQLKWGLEPPWTSPQSITGLTCRDKPADDSETPVHLTTMSLNCGRKPGYRREPKIFGSIFTSHTTPVHTFASFFANVNHINDQVTMTSLPEACLRRERDSCVQCC